MKAPRLSNFKQSPISTLGFLCELRNISIFPKTATYRQQVRFLRLSRKCSGRIQLQSLKLKDKTLTSQFSLGFAPKILSSGSYNLNLTEIQKQKYSKSENLLIKSAEHAGRKSKTCKNDSFIRRHGRFKIFLLAGIPLASVIWYAYLRYKGNQEAGFMLNDSDFTPFHVLKREQVSSTAIILTLCPDESNLESANLDLYKQWWDQGIWSVEVKQPELQIARLYTPLPPLPGQPLGYLRFLIRKEYGGEVSRYLHRLSVGSKIYLRGPHQEVKLPESLSKVLFIAGGTGIAPALQVAYTLLERRKSGEIVPSVHIVWANRRREDCSSGGSQNKEHSHPIVEQLEQLEQLRKEHFGHFNIEYLVDEEGKFITANKMRDLIRQAPNSNSTRGSQRFLFVSGPEGLINVVAGPKGWENGIQVQGDVGGFLSDNPLDILSVPTSAVIIST